jgi:hypothetical protein
VFLGCFGCIPATESGYVTSHGQAVQNLYVKAKQFNETDYIMRPKEFMTVKEFLKQIELGKIHKVEIYYISWGMTTHFPYSEEALRDHVAARVMKNPSVKHLSTIKLELEGITPVPKQAYSPDYRLGFVAHDCSGRVLTISFVYNQPVMSINGTQYIIRPKLVASVIELLPHKSYQEINNAIVHLYYWQYKYMWSHTQNNEQDKSN